MTQCTLKKLPVNHKNEYIFILDQNCLKVKFFPEENLNFLISKKFKKCQIFNLLHLSKIIQSPNKSDYIKVQVRTGTVPVGTGYRYLVTQNIYKKKPLKYINLINSECNCYKLPILKL